MEFVLPLDKMSTSDKLAALERLWEDLCHTAESVQSPWHGDVLSAREKRLKEGKSKFTSFDEAKDRISKERGRSEEYKLTAADEAASNRHPWGKIDFLKSVPYLTPHCDHG